MINVALVLPAILTYLEMDLRVPSEDSVMQSGEYHFTLYYRVYNRY